MAFAQPTDFVELSGVWRGDYPMLYAFDEALHLLGFVTPDQILSTQGTMNKGLVSFTSPEFDIKYVVAGGSLGPTGLDTLTYKVPEPATWLLIGVGILMFFRRVR